MLEMSEGKELRISMISQTEGYSNNYKNNFILGRRYLTCLTICGSTVTKGKTIFFFLATVPSRDVGMSVCPSEGWASGETAGKKWNLYFFANINGILSMTVSRCLTTQRDPFQFRKALKENILFLFIYFKYAIKF